jgi:dTDP-4-amino-4,6-dideoxygalactose transaminase
MLNGIDLDHRLEVRQNTANIYFDHLKDLEGKAFRKIYFSKENNNYRLFILLNKGHNPEGFSNYAEKQGWQFSPPVFRELPYKTPVLKNNFTDVSLPVTEDFCEHHICLPIHEGMKEEEAMFVAESARKYFNSF